MPEFWSIIVLMLLKEVQGGPSTNPNNRYPMFQLSVFYCRVLGIWDYLNLRFWGFGFGLGHFSGRPPRSAGSSLDEFGVPGFGLFRGLRSSRGILVLEFRV